MLSGLLASKHEVGLGISQPASRQGRGRKSTPPPVAKLALAENIPLLQPEVIGEIVEDVSRQDVLVVAAYGQILRPDTLYAATYGSYNVHASLLPAYRGAAPVERAIMAGQTETGISIMRMDEGLDTGPIALQKTMPISPDATGGEMTQTLARLGAEAIVEALTLLEENRLSLEKQNDSRATYAAKVSAGERTVPWRSSAEEVHDLIRALSPHIGARAFHPDFDGPVKVLRSRVAHDAEGLEPGALRVDDGRILAGCGKGAVELLELQLPGGKPLHSDAFLRGHSLRSSFFS